LGFSALVFIAFCIIASSGRRSGLHNLLAI
jgi:hypothetical protein